MIRRFLLPGMLVMAVAAGFCTPLTSDAAITPTAYMSYDTSHSPDIRVDTNDFIRWLESGGGTSVITPGAGRFGGAAVRTGAQVQLYADLGNPSPAERDITATFVPQQGTFEMWVSPHFNGTGEGGVGIGAPGAQQMLAGFDDGGGGLGGVSNGFKMALFNNGAPNDGGQLFTIWKTDSGSVWMENTAGLGTTSGWTAGSWHHVAFTWDQGDTSADASGTVAMFMDGNRLATGAMGALLPTFSNGFSVGGVYTNAQVPFDGDIDELIVWDGVRYVGETYEVPATAWPEPGTMVLLGAGGLLALMRRR